MLSEEALIFLGGLAALGAVALSVLELLWPTQARSPARRDPGGPEPPPVAPPPPAAAPRRRWRSTRPRHALNGSRSPYRRREKTDVETAEPWRAGEDQAPVAPRPAAAGTRVMTAEPVAPARPDTALDVDGAVDRCFALYEDRAYADVVAVAMPVITAGGSAAAVARLWSIVALARRAMEEPAAARAALESAIGMAADDERPAYERQLASLAAEVAQALLVQTEGARAPASEEDLRALRQALDWLECGAAAAPLDAALTDRAADVERRLWPTYERVVMTLVQRQQYGAARRLLREALDDPRFPAARAETFRELFSGTYGGEIGQLTAQAIRSMHDARETEALDALERAERLLDAIDEASLPPKRREEVDRRLWWGYKKLGRRRAQAGDWEAAAEALCHALRFAGVGTDRQADTRAALVRALEALVEQRARRIRELAESGNREAALVQGEDLRWRLRDAVAAGLAEEDVAGAAATAQRLCEEAGGPVRR